MGLRQVGRAGDASESPTGDPDEEEINKLLNCSIVKLLTLISAFISITISVYLLL